jgi:hypothetical protein
MALPINAPCSQCRVDTLHVWDIAMKLWRCTTCRTYKTRVQPAPIDVFMRRKRLKQFNPKGRCR